MYKLIIGCIAVCLCYGCGGLLDIAGKGTVDKSVYYDVAKNEIVSTNDTVLIKSLWFDQVIADNSVFFTRIVLPNASQTVEVPLVKDSVAYCDFIISVNLTGSHWREQNHITITKQLVAKKKKIYSRYTSH